MELNVANCENCGQIFQKTIRDICPACIRKEDKKYERCAEYLREHRGASLMELSEETGVSVSLISRFIREGRISLLNHPSLTYPCQSCGKEIRSGNLCESCLSRLRGEFSQLEQMEQRKHNQSTGQSGHHYKIHDNN